MPASSLANYSRDTEGFLEKSSLDLAFQENENEEGKNWLKSKGWNEGEKFVCLMVRDSTYLETNEQLRFFDWSYHDYRDSSIEDYLPALDWLTDRGVWVIRMGKTMKNQIKSEKISMSLNPSALIMYAIIYLLQPIIEEESVLKNAPHTMELSVNDDWNFMYSRQKAVYPLKWIKDNKFWPSVRRVDDAFGDRNLICTCTPIEAYMEV